MNEVKPGDRKAVLVGTAKFCKSCGEDHAVMETSTNELILVRPYKDSRAVKRDFPTSAIVVLEATDEFFKNRRGNPEEQYWRLVKD